MSLAQEGFHSPKQATPFSRQSVVELRRRFDVYHPRRRRRPALRDHAWWLSDLEQALGVANSTLHQWHKRGQLQARWHAQSKQWVAWADEAELQRLKQRCARPRGRGEPPHVARRATRPTDRITPRNHSLSSAEEIWNAT
jgi:hypothetical protein